MGVLIESAIRAALLALAAVTVLKVMRVTTAAARHSVWTLVLAGMVMLPVWTMWGPRVSIRVTGPRPVRAAPFTMPGPAIWAASATTAVPAPPQPFPAVSYGIAAPAAGAARSIPWSTIALAIYAVGVFVLFGRLMVGTLRAQRLIRQAVKRAGYLTSNTCSAPVTVGWIRPVVILPEGWKTWPCSQFEAVIQHEQEHVRRRDPLIQWIALANRAVFWFHPLAWWLERHLAELAENACDTAVLSKGHHPTEYCEYLLSMAGAVSSAGARIDVVGAALPGAFLTQRIRRILGAAPESRLPASRLALTLSASAVLSAAVIASRVAPAAEAPSSVLLQSVVGQALPEDWFDDDEWHLETASLMSAQEMERYKRVRTAAERETFISDFWKQRDLTPDTPANEFRREFERRITYAKERYADPESAATFGYQTDRGRWFVTSGPPDAVRAVGSPNIDKNGVSRQIEEWDYRSLDDLGSNVTVRFDAGSFFGCTYRGGKYRILSPAPVSRFEGVTSAGSGRRPIAQTYPGHFVYLSFPIDQQAVAIRWGMRTGRDGQLILDEENGPIDYVQGEIGSVSDDPTRSAPNQSRPAEPILQHLQGMRFFEPGGVACTEQLPPAVYTLRIETRLLNGTMRSDSVTFTVD